MPYPRSARQPKQAAKTLRRQAVFTRLAVVCVAVVALGGGVAWATIPGAGGVISACYSKTTGALRVIDKDKGPKCAALSELPLAWNQRGPTGPVGPTGPSMAYGFAGVGGIGLPQDTYTTVVQGALAAGNYAITATLTIDSVYSQADVYCDLYLDTTAIYDSIVTVDPGHNTTDTLIATGNLSAPGSVSVACAPTASNVFAQVSALDAVKVAALGS